MRAIRDLIHRDPPRILLLAAALAVTGLTLSMALPAPAVGANDPGLSERDLSDADIRQAVDAQLLLSRGVPVNRIDVSVQRGIVTLGGTVDNILAADRAVRVARMVKGVRSVVDRIRVEPRVERTDARLQQAISDALTDDPATDAWEVGVGAEDGHVTLVGTVDSWHEKQLATRIAKGVAGVRSIDNDLAIEYDAERSDSEIEAEIQRILMWDARVDDGLIEVEVTDGEVKLSGTVGSAYERSLAIGDAWAMGVESVDAEDLKVQWWARDEMLARDRFADVGDEEIRQAVQDALLFDPRVASFRPEVRVEDGVVTLSGVVDNLKAKRSAAQTAANTRGVWRVKNHLKVRPQEVRTDSEIASEIREDLLMDPYVNRFEVDVSVDDGIARLSGDVDSYFEKWQAGDVAATVQGVSAVRNRLKVDYEPLDYDYTFYDWDVVDSDYDLGETGGTMAAKGDWEIHEDIRDELWWSPFVDADEVTVTVVDGEATLTGEVDSWAERRAATEQALEGGAELVHNRLEVEWGPDLPL